MNLKKSLFLFPMAFSMTLASCGGEQGEDSSEIPSSETSSSSSSQVDPMERFFLDYEAAAELSLMQTDIGVSMTNGLAQFGMETKGEELSTWFDFSIAGENLGFDFAVNNLGKGKNKMKASFEMPQAAKLKISGTNLPSWIGLLLSPKMQVNAFFENGIFYLDMSKQPILNLILQGGIREASGDKTWNLVEQGHYELSSEENTAINALLSSISNLEPTADSYRAIYKASKETVKGESINGNEVLSIEVGTEDLLKEVLLSAYDNKGDIIGFLNGIFSEFIPDLKIPLDFDVTKEEYEEQVDKLLGCFVFNHFKRSMSFNPNLGMVSSYTDFLIDSFDHDKMLAYLEEFKSNEQSSVEVNALPFGKWKIDSGMNFEFGKSVQATVLTDEEKADFIDEITLPKTKTEQ